MAETQPVTGPGKFRIILKITAAAAGLALFAAFLCLLFLVVSLGLAADQLAVLILGILIAAPAMLVIDLAIGGALFFPVYGLLDHLQKGHEFGPDDSVKAWRALHRFPAFGMLASLGMWLGWTAFIAWWAVSRGALRLDDAVTAFPAFVLIGMSGAVGFYFSSRSILRPPLKMIGAGLGPDFSPDRLLPINRKLLLVFVFLCFSFFTAFGLIAMRWRDMGARDLAMSAAWSQIEDIKIAIVSGTAPGMEARRTETLQIIPFVVDSNLRLVHGSIPAEHLAVIAESPRLMGKSLHQKTHPTEAAIADFLAPILPPPPFTQSNTSAGEFWLALDPDQLRGGVHAGALVRFRTSDSWQTLPLGLWLGSFFLASLALSWLLVHYLARDLADPLCDLRSAMNDDALAEKEAITISNDETGLLAVSFRRQNSRLGREIGESERMVAAIRASVSNLVRLMTRLVDVSADQAAGATEQAASIHEVTTTSEEIAVTLRNISEHSRSVDEVAGKSLAACHDGQTLLQDINMGMASAMERAGDVADKMILFQEQADRIETILEFIREVSERINLISLNASIEASSAGESGQRFSIIASEMRKLAEKTMGGAKEIKELFTDLQSAASSAIVATEDGGKQVMAARRLTERAGDSFQNIIHWAGETARSAQEISTGSAQQTTASEHLASALGEINDVAGNFAEGAKSLETTVNELDRIIRELREIVDRSSPGSNS